MLILKFDDSTFTSTAKAVLKLNESAREAHDEISLVRFMKDMAEMYFRDEDSVFFGTAGFYLTAIPFSDKSGKLVVATLASWLVK